MRGFFEGLELPVDRDWLVVGRGRSADLLITEPTISRAHAAIGFDGEAFFVQDLGSTNGTLINGGPVSGDDGPRRRLKGGDVLQMGKLVVGISLPEG